MIFQLGVSFLILFASYFLLFVRRKHRTRCNDKKVLKMMIVLGSGGHTAEMLRFIDSIIKVGKEQFEPRVYVIAATDKYSEQKLKEVETGDKWKLVRIPRSREVGQSWITTIFTFAYSILFTLKLVLIDEKPDIIMTNGPGTCVPICVNAWLGNKVGLVNCRTVFIESFARVNSLSVSGKILYRIVDSFIVQWPELREKYPNAEYLGHLL